MKAGEILERFVNPKSPTTPGREIPAKILTRAKVSEIRTEISGNFPVRLHWDTRIH